MSGFQQVNCSVGLDFSISLRYNGDIPRSSFCVPAAATFPASINHHDLIRFFDGFEPIGDNDNGLAGDQPVQRLLDFPLIFYVQAGADLVQQKDRGVFQERTSDEDALPFAVIVVQPGDQPQYGTLSTAGGSHNSCIYLRWINVEII